MLRTTVFLLAFVSGFAVMAIELLGGRILAPYFGSSIYVWGSIISVFMLSLSFGYLLGGRWSLHDPTLQRLSLLFLTAGTTMLPIALQGDAVMDFIFTRVEDPRYGSLITAGCLFFLPTAVMGMITPYSVRLLVAGQHHSGQMAGLLYFISTLGSALGTLLTSFYLVLYFEINQILYTLVIAMFIGGSSALLVGYRQQEPVHP